MPAVAPPVSSLIRDTHIGLSRLALEVWNLSFESVADTLEEDLHSKHWDACSEIDYVLKQEFEGVPEPPPKYPGNNAGAPGEAALPPRPPKPGWRAYTIMVGSFCGLFASFGWRSGSGMFQDYYSKNQLRNYSPSTIAWINSVGFFLMYFGALFVNPLSAKYGPRRIMCIGSSLHVLGLLATSFSTKYWQFLLAQGVVSSLGASALFFTSISLMGRWFQRNQALTIGISTSGTSVGGVVFPLMIEHLLPKLGYAWTMRTVVLLIFVLVTVANIALRAPPAGSAGGERRKPPPLKGVKARLVAFKERKFTLTLMGLTFFSNGYFLVLTFIVSVASLRGWKDQVNAIICLNAASFFGRILPGMVAEYVGRFNTMAVLAGTSTVLILTLWVAGNNVPATIAFSVVFGFTTGSTISLGPSMIFQISELRAMSHNLSLLYGMQSVAALVVSPLGGALLARGRQHGPLYLQLFAGLIMGSGTFFIILARLQQSGLALRKRI